MSWINDLVSQHSELESPSAFWYWSGLCAISAVVKDTIYLDRYAFRTYPNIYVMLHAASGLKKGPPVGLAKRLVKLVNNTRIISGRSSIQGILKELGTAYTVPGGKVVNKSVGFIVASEFSSSLVADPAAMTILTDLYDRHYNEGEWRSLLKMESFNLKDPTLSLLVATNEAHFEDFIEAKDIHGGFIGRMFVIAETKVHRLNPLISKMDKVPDVPKLAEYLKELTHLKGAFASLEGTKAGKLYISWYENFYQQVENEKIADPTGTIQRFGDSVLKVAMLLALSEKPELIIQLPQMEEAINVCETLLGNVRKTTHGKNTKKQYAVEKGEIIAILLERTPPKITRRMLIHKLHLKLNSEEVDEIMRTFEAAGIVAIKQEGNQIVYEMPAKQYQEYRDFLAGKN